MAPRLRYHTRFVPAPNFHIADFSGDTSATYQAATSDRLYSFVKSSPFHTSIGYTNRTVTSSITASEVPHVHPAFLSSLGLLILFVSVAAVIILIAFVIGKVRRKQNSMEDIEQGVETMDPYIQAIQFPEDNKQDWQKVVKSSLKMASQKIRRKSVAPESMGIPEELKYQLKYIYVY